MSQSNAILTSFPASEPNWVTFSFMGNEESEYDPARGLSRKQAAGRSVLDGSS